MVLCIATMEWRCATTSKPDKQLIEDLPKKVRIPYKNYNSAIKLFDCSNSNMYLLHNYDNQVIIDVLSCVLIIYDILL